MYYWRCSMSAWCDDLLDLPGWYCTTFVHVVGRLQTAALVMTRALAFCVESAIIELFTATQSID